MDAGACLIARQRLDGLFVNLKWGEWMRFWVCGGEVVKLGMLVLLMFGMV